MGSKKRKPNSTNPAKQARQEAGTDMLWVRTEPTLDGKGWTTTVDFDDDHSISLAPGQVVAYSNALLMACATADYDAAVFAQLVKRVKSENHAIMTVMDLRKDRPEPVEVEGYSFVGGISHKTKRGFITINFNGEGLHQLDVEPARGHALHVLEALIVADLDAAYLTHLRGIVGLEEPVARAVIAELAVHR